MNFKFSFGFLMVALAIISSCNPGKNLKSIVYLNNVGDSAAYANVTTYETIIQPGDRLTITVSALNPLSAAQFNMATISATTTTGAGAAATGYLVDKDGNIAFPQLGKIKTAGLTRTQLINNLTKTLVKYLTDPVITVEFINFRITVLGEVNLPGTKVVPEGEINLIEAIGLSGDLTIYGKRENILIIREKNGKRQLGHIDLTSTNVFASPYYQLKQNDIIYIEMTKNKVASSDQVTIRNISIITSVATVTTSLIVLIISLLK